MKKHIEIVEIATGKSVAVVPVVLSGINYIPSATAFEEEAWNAAADDGIVSQTDRHKHTFVERPSQEA